MEAVDFDLAGGGRRMNRPTAPRTTKSRHPTASSSRHNTVTVAPAAHHPVRPTRAICSGQNQRSRDAANGHIASIPINPRRPSQAHERARVASERPAPTGVNANSGAAPPASARAYSGRPSSGHGGGSSASRSGPPADARLSASLRTASKCRPPARSLFFFKRSSNASSGARPFGQAAADPVGEASSIRRARRHAA